MTIFSFETKLRQEALSSKLKSGAPLREVNLSERFGVSRGPVREAFRQLTQQGLLVLESNDVAALTEHDLRFHQAIIRSHDDKDLFALWQPIAMRMMMRYNRLDDIMDSYRERKRILDAISAGDKMAPLDALETNIQ